MPFLIHFLLCNVSLSILLCIVLLLKRISKKYTAPRSQYYIWYVYVLALLLPFVPCQIFLPDQLISEGESALLNAAPYLTAVWAAGCIVMLLYFVWNIFKICKIKRSAYFVTAENEPDLYRRYLSCMKELDLRRGVSLYASCEISSPISCGLFYPTVIIPQDMDILLPPEDIHFIFLHELLHCRNKDTLLSYMSCILQAVYWFNPCIWYAFRVMRRDREIADYRPLTPGRRFRGICILLTAFVLVCSASPLLTVYASRGSSSVLADADVQAVDLASYFRGNEGSFVLYDITEDRFLVYNEELGERRAAPAIPLIHGIRIKRFPPPCASPETGTSRYWIRICGTPSSMPVTVRSTTAPDT